VNVTSARSPSAVVTLSLTRGRLRRDDGRLLREAELAARGLDRLDPRHRLAGDALVLGLQALLGGARGEAGLPGLRPLHCPVERELERDPDEGADCTTGRDPPSASPGCRPKPFNCSHALKSSRGRATSTASSAATRWIATAFSSRVSEYAPSCAAAAASSAVMSVGCGSGADSLAAIAPSGLAADTTGNPINTASAALRRTTSRLAIANASRSEAWSVRKTSTSKRLVAGRDASLHLGELTV